MKTLVVYSRAQEANATGQTLAKKLQELPGEERPDRVRYRNADAQRLQPLADASAVLTTEAAAEKVKALYEDADVDVAVLELGSSEQEDASDGAGETPPPTKGAKALAEKEDVDLSEVEGSGKDGRITKPDVESHVEGSGDDDSGETEES